MDNPKLDKIKILIHSNYHPENYGGIESVVSQLIGTLTSVGYDVECFCGQAGATGVSAHKGALVYHQRIIGKVFGAPILLFGNLKFLLHSHRAELIIFQEPFPFLWPAIFFLRRILKHRLVVLVHATPNAQRTVRWLYKKLRDIVFNGAVCVTTSPNLFNQINTSAYAGTTIVPLGVSDISRPAGKKIRQKYALYLGRLAGYKGIEQLLKAVSNLPEIRFVIAGAGPLSQQVRDFHADGKHTNMTFIDRFVSDEEKVELISNSSFLIFPSTNKNEAFGIVQLEAMRAGKPVINTWLDTGVNYVAPNGVCAITVQPYDHEALSEAIMRLWLDTKLRQSLGEAARRRYIQHFTDEAFRKRWNNLVGKLLQTKTNS